MGENTKLRNSSIELLRILCMMFIVMHHIIITTVAPQFSSAVYNGFDTVFHTAVVIFVIISGYYGINFTVNKLVKLWVQVAYYSVLAGLIAFFVLHSIGVKSLLGCFFPIYTRPYWFVSAYIELYLFSPILNVITHKASRRQLLAGILVLMFSTWAFPTDLLSGTGLPVFSMLYLVGRYMAKYKAYSYRKNKQVALYLFIMIAVITLLGILCPQKSRLFYTYLGLCYRYYSVGTLLLSLLIFLFFRNIVFHSKIINYMARSVFAIYLIHENHLVSQYTYEMPVRWLIATGFPSGLAMVIVAFVLVLFCVGLDQIRIFFFKLCEPLFDLIERIILKSYQKFITLFKLLE